jgi:hypothetical protein
VCRRELGAAEFYWECFFCGERVMQAAKSGHIQKGGVEGRLEFKIEDCIT